VPAQPAAVAQQTSQQPANQQHPQKPSQAVEAAATGTSLAAASAEQPATVSQSHPPQQVTQQHGGVMDGVLKQELQQLQDSYLLLQDEYWRQKDRLMALEIEAGQLRVSTEHAQATAAQVGVQLLLLLLECSDRYQTCWVKCNKRACFKCGNSSGKSITLHPFACVLIC
jgi:hypothetical protein